MLGFGAHAALDETSKRLRAAERNGTVRERSNLGMLREAPMNCTES